LLTPPSPFVSSRTCPYRRQLALRAPALRDC
jgi:hypothetical protein